MLNLTNTVFYHTLKRKSPQFLFIASVNYQLISISFIEILAERHSNNALNIQINYHMLVLGTNLQFDLLQLMNKFIIGMN